jgi:hypothetical protein
MASQSISRPGGSLLQSVLTANALFSVVCGMVFVAAARPIAELLGLGVVWPVGFVGVGLLAFAAVVWRTAQRLPESRREAVVILTMDIAWVVASVAVLLAGWPATTAGWWAVAIVGDMVALIAILEYIGLRRLG